jgi:uncharacterized MnhB-related membrane protein
MILDFIQYILLAGILTSSVMALRSKDLLAAAIFLAVMSLLLSVEFYILQAPDVAFAEAAIGAGLGTAIFIISISKTERWDGERPDN